MLNNFVLVVFAITQLVDFRIYHGGKMYAKGQFTTDNIFDDPCVANDEFCVAASTELKNLKSMLNSAVDDIGHHKASHEGLTNKNLDDVQNELTKTQLDLAKTSQELNQTRNELYSVKVMVQQLKTVIILYEDCADAYSRGRTTDGVYKIYLRDVVEPVQVYCDMTTDGGGWTVFQKRFNGSVDFYKSWDSYKLGFGNINTGFWLGNEIIHRLTNQKEYELRIDLKDRNGNTAYAEYTSFSISSEGSGYMLNLGNYSGTAGDSMGYSNGYAFSTKDKDNDGVPHNCAHTFRGAWWYNGCTYSNLNGLYSPGHSSINSMHWWHFNNTEEGLLKSEMKIRPSGFKAP